MNESDKITVLTTLHGSLTNELTAHHQGVSKALFAYGTLMFAIAGATTQIKLDIIAVCFIFTMVLAVAIVSWLNLWRQIRSYDEVSHALARVEWAVKGFEVGVFIKDEALLPKAWEKHSNGKSPRRFVEFLWLLAILSGLTLVMIVFAYTEAI